ncbi:MAG TPA: cupin domain-containing protein [Candidatus Pristimantibacillus sp.]|jgi:mannose-6-phosphate isomerase-like protein (cupin superfamily)|nr:cupin domain-containing protein [Candidatus Pristimantibacillus sp.]
MHIPFSTAYKIDTDGGPIWDYDINKDVGLSYQELHRRGPESGHYLNKKCHEILFVIRGSARFTVGGKEYDVHEKDTVVVEPGVPYAIDTTDLAYITITRPDWYEEQYELVG